MSPQCHFNLIKFSVSPCLLPRLPAWWGFVPANNESAFSCFISLLLFCCYQFLRKSKILQCQKFDLAFLVPFSAPPEPLCASYHFICLSDHWIRNLIFSFCLEKLVPLVPSGADGWSTWNEPHCLQQFEHNCSLQSLSSSFSESINLFKLPFTDFPPPSPISQRLNDHSREEKKLSQHHPKSECRVIKLLMGEDDIRHGNFNIFSPFNRLMVKYLSFVNGCRIVFHLACQH